MAVKSLAPYTVPQQDTVDKFPAPLLYIGWEDHKLFCSPVCMPMPPGTKFSELVHGTLPGVYSAHPDFARIHWDQTEWFLSGRPFTPDMEKTVAQNGIGHKSVLRFRTPGLTGLQGSCF